MAAYNRPRLRAPGPARDPSTLQKLEEIEREQQIAAPIMNTPPQPIPDPKAGLNSYRAGQFLTGLGMAQDVWSLFQARMFNKRRDRFNDKVAQFNEQRARERGQLIADQIRREGDQIVGSQRASFAAQGIELGDGTAQAVIDDTRRQIELDALRAEINGDVEAFGFRNEINDRAIQRAQSDLETNYRIQGSLVTGGRQLMEQRRRYEQAGLNG